MKLSLLIAAGLFQSLVAAGPVEVTVMVETPVRPRMISPYIYGTCQTLRNMDQLTFVRNGGNRMTAYNWEVNASNAGADWHHQNDGFLTDSNKPGKFIEDFLTPVLARGQTAVVTIPMTDYVAADKRGGGDVKQTPDYLSTRFKKNRAAKGAPFVDPPDAGDAFVYQDEFIHWIESRFPRAERRGDIWYALDNEPDLWSETHARIHPAKVTCAELLERTLTWSRAIKNAAPDSRVFGFVSYGYNGFTTLNGASDANGRNFIDFFLRGVSAAGKSENRRLVDVLDLHWYPETRGGDRRIIDGAPAGGDETVAARVQAPRHLYDPAFREKSWIDSVLGEGINLLPRLQKQISAADPGMKLAFTEYNYGGTDDISGALAQADVLGAFGCHGVFASSFWSLAGSNRFVSAAFDLFRNYDGRGGTFGDQALDTTSSDLASVSAWAATGSSGKFTLLIINRSTGIVSLTLKGSALPAKTSTLYRLTGGTPEVKHAGTAELARPVSLPPMSATLFAAGQ